MNEPDTWRLFVALPIPASVVETLVALQTELTETLPKASVRWMKPEKFHLTLCFLGDVEKERIGPLKETLSDIASTSAPLDLLAERIGFFPSDRLPRILWAWVHDEPNQLPSLAKRLNRDLAKFADLEPGSNYTGHITIGRCQRFSRKEKKHLIELAQQLVERRFGAWVADEMVLMRSQLDNSGSVYSDIARFPLTARH